MGHCAGLVYIRHGPSRNDMDWCAHHHIQRIVHCMARTSTSGSAAKGYHSMTQPILYHCPDARSLRCLWAVEEVGMDVTLHNLPFPPRAFAPEYRAVNPLMTVPAWVEN